MLDYALGGAGVMGSGKLWDRAQDNVLWDVGVLQWWI